MLTVHRTLYKTVIAHCRKEYPKEACGLLGGHILPAGMGFEVLAVYPMKNVEGSPIGYSMYPKEQLLVMKKMRERSQEMIGIYHSHTATDAYPSSVDVKLSLGPEISYVLVSLKDYDNALLRSFRVDSSPLKSQQITEEPVRILDDPMLHAKPLGEG